MIMTGFPPAQYLNWDVLGDRHILNRQSWNPILASWHWTRSKRCRTGKTGSVVDGKPAGRALLVMGSARMKPGARPAIRWLAVTWLSACTHSRYGNCGVSRAVQRWRPSRASWNGAAFPNPALPTRPRMPTVGGGGISPISSARTFWSFPAFRRLIPCGSSSNCCAKGSVRRCPWPPLPATWPVAHHPQGLSRHPPGPLYRLCRPALAPRHLARAILQTPKVYFFDTGLVRGDEGIRLGNAFATMLLKPVHFLQDAFNSSCEEWVGTSARYRRGTALKSWVVNHPPRRKRHSMKPAMPRHTTQKTA